MFNRVNRFQIIFSSSRCFAVAFVQNMSNIIICIYGETELMAFVTIKKKKQKNRNKQTNKSTQTGITWLGLAAYQRIVYA